MDHGLGPVHDGLTWWRGQETTGERPGWHSGLPVLAGVCREGEGRCGGLTTGLTGAQGVTERPGDSGEVVAVVGLGGMCSDLGEGRGAMSGAGCYRPEVPFYRGRGRASGDDNGASGEKQVAA
jgi:hypothetical protein